MRHTLMPNFKLNSIQEKSEESMISQENINSVADIELSTGTCFQGKIQQNRLQGKGELKFEDEDLGIAQFKGNFIKNKANGYCELSLNNKIMFKGNFQNQKVNGIGELIEDDLLYMGQWQQNKQNGYGRAIKKDFAIYEGQFRNGKREGLGIEIYTNSDLYMGEFLDDKKHGYGIYFFQKNNSYYKGQFRNNTREGFGVVYRKQKLEYNGYWKNDKKHGKGKESYSNGSQYEGFFEYGKRNGAGMMIYNETLNYIGEWKDNKQEGYGKISLNNQTISGIFQNNKLQRTQPVDIGNIIQILQQDIKEEHYKLKQIKIQEQSELYKVIKEKLKTIVFQFAVEAILNIEMYLIINNIFGDLTFEDVLNQIQKQMLGELNIEEYLTVWSQKQKSMKADNLKLEWNQWEIQKKLSEDFYVVELTKNSESFPMIISESVVLGELDNKILKGGILEDKLFIHLIRDGKILESCRGIIYPHFIHLNKDTIVSLNMSKYKGYFIFNREKKDKKELTMFLNIKSGLIYSFGIDMIGTFVITGYYNYQEKRAQFVQKYSKDYQISYNIFSFDFNKIYGYWSTTNIKGYFELYRDESYNQNQNIIEVVEQKYSGKFDPVKFNKLKSQTILSVILNKSEEEKQSRTFLDSLNLNRINKMKKQKLAKLNNRPKAMTTQLNFTTDSKFDTKIATSQLLEEQFSELNKDQMSNTKKSYNEERVFLRRISKMLSRIGIGSKSKKEEQVNLSDNFIWMGVIKTLGKNENIVIKNMYIKNNLQIEGVFLFQSQIYELYGQYRGENKEIEIMGFSLNQKHSLRIIGELTEHKINGKLYSSKVNLPESQIKLEFQAEEIKIELKCNGIIYKDVKCIWKQIRGYIFAMFFLKEQTWFVKGKEDIKLGIQLEVFSSYQPQTILDLMEVFQDKDSKIKIFKKDQNYLKVFFQLNYKIYLFIQNKNFIHKNLQNVSLTTSSYTFTYTYILKKKQKILQKNQQY